MAAMLGPLLGAANQPSQQMQQQQVAPQKQNPFNFAGQSAPSPQQFSQGVQQSAPSKPLSKEESTSNLMSILSMLGGK